MNLKIYEYWFEYLKRSEGYKECCEAGGVGEYWALHEDFGNVHAVTFDQWWPEHKHLFLEKVTRPPMDRITNIDQLSQRDFDDPDTLIINVNIYEESSVLTDALRKLLKQVASFKHREKDDSTSQYFIATNTKPDTLKIALEVYDKVESERAKGSSVSTAYTEAGKTISSISEKHCSASGKVVHPEDLIAEVKEIYRMAKTMIKNVAQPDVHFAEFSMRYGKSQFPLPKNTARACDD